MDKTLATLMGGLALTLAGAGAHANTAAGAETAPYPSRSVRVVVPFPAGAVTDLSARLVFEKVSTLLDQPFVVENRSGAGSRVGSEAVRKSQADGYTLLFTNSSFGALQVVAPDFKLDIKKDFEPVAMVAQYGLLVAVNADLPVKSMRELIAHAKANPGKLDYGSAGVASGSHFTGEYLNRLAGTQITHVPYRSTAQALTDVARGELSMAFDSTVENYTAAGKIRLLATTHSERDPRFPDVPTIGEAGFPDMVRPSWNGVLAPGGTPKEVLRTLNQAINKALADPTIKERLNQMGLLTAGGEPQALDTQLANDTDFFKNAAAAANLKFD